MEMPINKEIRNYTESVFFGLTMRQFIFSAAACLIAVLLYFSFRNRFGIETVSWICTLGAAPMACFGFIRYHGMNLEQFLWTWLRSEVLMPKYLTAGNTNIYYQAFKPLISKLQKGDENHVDESDTAEDQPGQGDQEDPEDHAGDDPDKGTL